MTKIALFNDTGNFPHAGCLAVSQAHDKMLAKAGAQIAYRHYVTELKELWKGDAEAARRAVESSEVHQELDAVDAVVVNGEGTIHHGWGLHLLALLDAAQRLGKKTFLVNSVIQECDVYHDVMQRLTDLTVRDAHSSSYLTQLGIKHRTVLDSVLEADFSRKNSIDFHGKIVVTDFHHSKVDVGAALDKLLREYGEDAVYYPLEGNERFEDWRHFVANLKTARLVVTGRHHGVYLAALAERPFVALPSNTWKIEGTFALFHKHIKVLEDYSSLESECKKALANTPLYSEFSRFLLKQRPLSTFEGIDGQSLSSRLTGMIKRFLRH